MADGELLIFRLFRKFARTLSYVSIFPLAKIKIESEEDLHGLSAYLPAAGLFIGLILALLFQGLEAVSANHLVSSFLLVLSWLAFTGGIHMDGLMDTCDGIFSQRERRAMLEIMKDSRVGNFGAMGGFIAFLAKLFALLTMPDFLALPALILVPACSRWAEVYAIVSFPYAREEGMGKIWHSTSRRQDVYYSAIPIALAVLLMFLFCRLLNFCSLSQAVSSCVLIIPSAALSGLLFSHLLAKILGGQTGDSYGATVEFSESASLLLISLMSGLIDSLS